jgi:hypothetical protein
MVLLLSLNLSPDLLIFPLTSLVLLSDQQMPIAHASIFMSNNNLQFKEAGKKECANIHQLLVSKPDTKVLMYHNGKAKQSKNFRISKRLEIASVPRPNNLDKHHSKNPVNCNNM